MTFRPSGYVTVNGVNSNDLFFVVEATKIESLLLSFGDVKIMKRMNGRNVFLGCWAWSEQYHFQRGV